MGSFGEVFSGTWKGTPVAIKTLKSDATEQSQLDFSVEANVMRSVFTRVCVVVCEGQCFLNSNFICL